MERQLKLVISIGYWALSWFVEKLSRACGFAPAGRCVVLYYHGVSATQHDAFQRQMDYLLHVATPVAADLHELPADHGRRYVAVTFDDSFQSAAEHAFPCLLQQRIPFTVFVPTAYIGQKTGWHLWGESAYSEEIGMTAEQLRTLPTDLVTIASHSATHPDLRALPASEASQEIEQSRIDLESMLGRPIRLFSFPYGAYNDDLLETCRRAGYERVFTTLPGFAFTRPGEFLTGRIEVTPDNGPLEFALKIRGCYNWLPAAIAAKRRLRRIVFSGVGTFRPAARPAPDRRDQSRASGRKRP